MPSKIKPAQFKTPAHAGSDPRDVAEWLIRIQGRAAIYTKDPDRGWDVLLALSESLGVPVSGFVVEADGLRVELFDRATDVKEADFTASVTDVPSAVGWLAKGSRPVAWLLPGGTA